MIRSRRERLRITSLIVFRRSATVSVLVRGNNLLWNALRHDKYQRLRTVPFWETTGRTNAGSQSDNHRQQKPPPATHHDAEDLLRLVLLSWQHALPSLHGYPECQSDAYPVALEHRRDSQRQLGAASKIVVVVQVLAVYGPHARQSVANANIAVYVSKVDELRANADSPSEKPTEERKSQRELNNPSTTAVNPLL